jgi:cytochrome c5
MPITERRAGVALAIILAWLLTACGKSTPQPAEAAPKTAPVTTASTPFNMSSVFPPGPGRELVLNTCGSCHSAVCATRGQRTA